MKIVLERTRSKTGSCRDATTVMLHYRREVFPERRQKTQDTRHKAQDQRIEPLGVCDLIVRKE